MRQTRTSAEEGLRCSGAVLCDAVLWLAVQCVQEIWMRGEVQGYGRVERG